MSQGAKAPHGKLLLSSADKPGLITDVVAATADTIAKKKDDIKGFMRAWYKALAFIKANPDEANKIRAQGVGGWLNDPAVFADTLKGIEYLDKDKNAVFFGKPEAPGQINKTLGTALEVLKSVDCIHVDVKPADMIDHNFIGG